VILKNLEILQHKIAQACQAASRDPNTVRVLAVSKGHSVEQILEAYALGLRDFGENYAAEMEKKLRDERLQLPDLKWHFVGHIQSNKLRSIATASWVHTLSNTVHAETLSRFMPPDRVMNTLLQVNLGKEDQRSGAFPEDLLSTYAQVMKLPRLNLCGLMTIPPQSQEPAFWFQKMIALKNQLEQKIGAAVPELSMGMSGDFEEAIKHGATWIRVGTMLFGERENKSKD
jgi:pyridoxal phosphate enzyme (YggS family)